MAPAPSNGKAIPSAAMSVASSSDSDYNVKTTLYVVLASIVAASGGLIFGYQLGISGGVSSMDDFLQKFFPVVYRNKHLPSTIAHENHYCKYNNQILVTFTSSLYLTAMIASAVASHITKSYGRRLSIFVAGLSFFFGVILTGAAKVLPMLIVGRLLLGLGIGFNTQAVPLYLSEVAPPKLRGAMNIMFQLAISIGVAIANLINYGTSKIHPWGWRLSLSLAGLPTLIVLFGSIFLQDSPNSLVNRGFTKEGRRLLERIRGTSNVDIEYNDIVEASNKANLVQNAFHSLVERKNRPALVLAILLPAFQQLAGVNLVTFYAPVLFSTIGFGNSAALYSAVIIGVVGIGANVISMAIADKYGRRKLLLVGGTFMLICQVLLGVILAFKFGGTKDLSRGWSSIVVVLICLYVLAFGSSWGPVAWLVPSEIFPLEARSAGYSVTVCVNMLLTFIIAQAFLSMLCAFKFGVFLFFASWLVVMTIFVYFFMPETRNIPIEDMPNIWKGHWFWKTYVAQV